MKSGKQTVFVTSGVGLLCLGFGVYAGYLLSRADTPVYAPIVSQPIEEVKPNQVTAPGTTMTLNFGTRLTVPTGWKVTVNEAGLDRQVVQYTVNTGDSEFNLQEIKASVWAKGQRVDGYQLEPAERATLLAGMKELYDSQGLSQEFTAAFNEQAGDFFGYSQSNRVARQYLVSSDKEFRGLSFFNLDGQSSVLYPIYYAVLYNPTTDVILVANYGIDVEVAEIAVLNKQIELGMQTSDSIVLELDKKARADFAKLLKTKTRAELSFGRALEGVDAFLRTAH